MIIKNFDYIKKYWITRKKNLPQKLLNLENEWNFYKIKRRIWKKN
jgi:hypothetical protein